MNTKLLLSISLLIISINIAYLITINFLISDIESYYNTIALALNSLIMATLSYFYHKLNKALQTQSDDKYSRDNRRVILEVQENAQPVLTSSQNYQNTQTSDQLLISHFPDFLCIKDAQGKWLAANYDYLRLFSLEQANYWGKTDAELATNYPKSNTNELKTSSIQDKSAWHQRCRLTETRKIDDSQSWIISRTPLFDKAQNRLKLIITGQFINAENNNTSRLERVADAFDEGNLIFAFLNRDFLVTDINTTFTQLMGYSIEEIENKPLALFIEGKFELNSADFIKENNKQYWSGEVRCKPKNTAAFPVKLDVTAIIKENKPITYFASFIDITRQKQIERRIMQLSYYDELTNLPNRMMFFDRLSRVVSAETNKNISAIILFIDLDRFKAINDSLGHDAGNALLKEVAKRLNSLIKKGDLVARFNGDEFAVLSITEGAYQQAVYSATLLAESIIRVLSAEFELNHLQKTRQVFVGASVGVTVYPEDGMSAELLLKNADIAMYKAKCEGGNSYQFYKKNTAISAQERLELEADLRKAMVKNELQLYYQPQYGAISREICGAEVLIRWFRAGKMVPPDYFIYIAEETDLIIDMGRWILRTACQKMKQWLVAGYPLPRVSVNVSARQFIDVNFLKYVKEALEEVNLEPHYLELELTESMLVGDIKRIELQLNRLKKMGIHIALDDFGTGYSSLSYLKNFPIDMLKIDKSFIMEMTQGSKDAQIAHAIIEMGHSLGQKIIAEGVETEEQLLYLAHRGCDIIQGYYFSPPLSTEKMTVLLRTEAEDPSAIRKRLDKQLFE